MYLKNPCHRITKIYNKIKNQLQFKTFQCILEYYLYMMFHALATILSIIYFISLSDHNSGTPGPI